MFGFRLLPPTPPLKLLLVDFREIVTLSDCSRLSVSPTLRLFLSHLLALLLL